MSDHDDHEHTPDLGDTDGLQWDLDAYLRFVNDDTPPQPHFDHVTADQPVRYLRKGETPTHAFTSRNGFDMSLPGRPQVQPHTILASQGNACPTPSMDTGDARLSGSAPSMPAVDVDGLDWRLLMGESEENGMLTLMTPDEIAPAPAYGLPTMSDTESQNPTSQSATSPLASARGSKSTKNDQSGRSAKPLDLVAKPPSKNSAKRQRQNNTAAVRYRLFFRKFCFHQQTHSIIQESRTATVSLRMDRPSKQSASGQTEASVASVDPSGLDLWKPGYVSGMNRLILQAIWPKTRCDKSQYTTLKDTALTFDRKLRECLQTYKQAVLAYDHDGSILITGYGKRESELGPDLVGLEPAQAIDKRSHRRRAKRAAGASDKT
ncbi:uncharacterized protein MKK02DRAFT_38799 [Dioszegia hungarica]|uniref:Uncharacterized protein n=1 Tax=Dioszegia hungarica TaxID=4972 RepID=A0AA38H3S3_9TREE|nr:uncharacterized protein MKK02DRAFT_38799 [Dioszegia hungarica]KAI9634127.1 hypothetical protein MKK02DRAFT_38799 [Dioszegia hungarica]